MYEYKTSGTCAQRILFDVVDGKVHNVQFIGGCNGNLKGIAALVEGMDVDTVIAFSGCVTDDARAVNQQGIDAYFPIMRAPVTLEEALNKNNASRNLADTAEQVFRLL